MKTFVASLVILTLLTAGVLTNSFFASRAFSRTARELEAFPSDPFEVPTNEMLSLKDDFERSSDYFSFILGKSEFRELNCLLSDIFAYYEKGDVASYTASVERLKIHLLALSESEGINLLGIFGNK